MAEKVGPEYILSEAEIGEAVCDWCRKHNHTLGTGRYVFELDETLGGAIIGRVHPKRSA